ncbi:MAG TPA: polymer-forming cytoskeletal protein [Gemmatimonadaceae bacterium]|nr:polymer-forming cytoskeletal protein [Gemmatimonadaceae bacterium]
MAIFSKEAAERTSDVRAAATGDGALSIIAAGMVVLGDIESNGVVKVEGRVEGTIRAARQVLIGRQGEVKGDVDTPEAVIGGKVEGRITTTERIEIQATALVDGDVFTKAILILEGGRINGTVRMDEKVARPNRTTGEQKPVAMLR